LRFFFGVTMGRPEAFDRIISAKEPKKLPVVLSGEEIVRFLRAVPGLRNRAALTTAIRTRFSPRVRKCVAPIQALMAAAARPGARRDAHPQADGRTSVRNPFPDIPGPGR
jgi:integrase